ncbi:putative ABC transporter ATP-binding protein YbhF [Polystyrenella longa]|uniref:Putative ABC transporter ATP-binding protein YbhF n=1 Tax=Polystyrenella longa TaxID=2528007 RepID=A0A518CHT3_9PLAN|nr:ABC transporter ATP-binding protein [Polystyrenella longa]QDU78785.1 putative ABC transporter ATP-binding protein YbhF [Polystyrenella longa]
MTDSIETNIVEINNLRVHYGKLIAVDGVSFSIPKGEVFGFIGPNGAGKSTTIKVLATLQREFTAEKVLVKGFDVRLQARKVRECIGYMPDYFGKYDNLTSREYLHFFAAAYKIEINKRDAIISDVLELTDLTGKIDAQVDSLSRGMKQRLALARVLLHDPDLLLLDEPASGLDPRARIEIRELLRALRDMGKTILISSHILHELSQLCTSIGIIETGKLVTQGTLEDIYERLSLMRIVHTQVTNLDDDMVARIEKIAGIQSVERQIDRLALRLKEGETSIEELHEKLVESGARIRMFQPEAMDMETAFMKLTEGKTA